MLIIKTQNNITNNNNFDYTIHLNLNLNLNYIRYFWWTSQNFGKQLGTKNKRLIWLIGLWKSKNKNNSKISVLISYWSEFLIDLLVLRTFVIFRLINKLLGT